MKRNREYDRIVKKLKVEKEQILILREIKRLNKAKELPLDILCYINKLIYTLRYSAKVYLWTIPYNFETHNKLDLAYGLKDFVHLYQLSDFGKKLKIEINRGRREEILKKITYFNVDLNKLLSHVYLYPHDYHGSSSVQY